jgi:hypothetical protein
MGVVKPGQSVTWTDGGRERFGIIAHVGGGLVVILDTDGERRTLPVTAVRPGARLADGRDGFTV